MLVVQGQKQVDHQVVAEGEQSALADRAVPLGGISVPARTVFPNTTLFKDRHSVKRSKLNKATINSSD